jgi:hypothetical protein
MPKPEPSATSPLTAREATQKIAAFITEPDEARPEDADDQQDAATHAAPADVPPAPPPPEPAAQETPPTEEPDYEVTVDGETLRVDLAELRAGYQKHEDYKRKTMALAEERKTFEAESSAVQAERAQYVEGLRQVRQALEQLTGEPDWTKRRAELSAEEFLKEKADWELSKAQMEKLKLEEQRVRDAAQADEAKKFQSYVRAEQDKLKVALPDWADPDKAKAEAARLRAHGKTYGFSDKELDSVVDARVILLLRDAMKYRELQREPSEKAKAKTPAIRTAKPGAAPPPPPPNARQQQLIDRAAQTHRTRDAVEAVKALLSD